MARRRLTPKSISSTDPAAQWTARRHGPAVYAYSDNYLVDLKNAVIMDVEATTAVRQAEVGAAKTMLDRTAETRFNLTPSLLVADAGYGSADMVGWLVDERGINRTSNYGQVRPYGRNVLPRDFIYDPEAQRLRLPRRQRADPISGTYAIPRSGVTAEGTLLYFASKHDCDVCALKPKCCPNAAARKIPRSIHEAARDKARAIARPRPMWSHAGGRRSRCSSPT